MTTHTTTITTPLGTTSPVLWMELGTERETTTRVVTGQNGQPLAVLYGPRPRARHSRLILLYDSEIEARRCEDLHAYGGICTITEPDRATHSMRYVPTGQIVRTLDPETACVWRVEIDVTEIP